MSWQPAVSTAYACRGAEVYQGLAWSKCLWRLANRPKLLLADEPTGNLDPATSDTVFTLLLQLVRDTGLSALIATHNLDLAGRMDQTLRLDQGQISIVQRI